MLNKNESRLTEKTPIMGGTCKAGIFSPIFGFYAICATAAAADSLTPDQMRRAADATDLLSRPCAYSISRKTVDMVVDTNQEEATKMAIGLAKYAVEGTMVRISLPHAHDEPVAISVSR